MNNTTSNTTAAFAEKFSENSLSSGQKIRARIIKLFFALLLFSGVLLIHSMEPSELPLPECSFKSITGLPCPTCGITRSVHAAANLKIQESFIQHPYGLIIISFVSVLFFILLAEAITGRTVSFEPAKMIVKKSVIGLVSVWGIYWLVKICYVLVNSF